MAKLEDYTVPVLRKLIKAYNLHTAIRGYSTMNKTDLITNIKKHFGIIDDTLQPILHSAFKVNEQLQKFEKAKSVKAPKSTADYIVDQDITTKLSKIQKTNFDLLIDDQFGRVNGKPKEGKYIKKLYEKYGDIKFATRIFSSYYQITKDENLYELKFYLEYPDRKYRENFKISFLM